ncbi:MAG TPA: agmatinase [Chitinophagales bacterium]|nr:agmatinase [Chitinophagales bacterium]
MIKLIGIPFDANSSYLRGPALAPSRIRQMDIDGSANAFSENGVEIKEGVNYLDGGDLHFESDDPAAAFSLIRKRIEEQLSGNSKIICLGGDHSVSFPLIHAYASFYQPLHVLHIDAHADLYDAFGNNPFSHASPFARIMEKGLVNSLTQAGIRTLNTHQRQQAKRFNVRIIEARHFEDDFIETLQGPLYISLDMDVLDPAFAPGVSHHEPGGLSTREVIRMIHRIKVPVVGADIVEYNPLRDINNMTAMVAYKMFKELVSVMMR